MDDFYAARSRTIPPLPWSNFAPPISEVKKVGSVSDLVEIAHSQAGLAVGLGAVMIGIGEGRFVLLHAGAAKERGLVVRLYGLDLREVDAFGLAIALIRLNYASRGDIGNLLFLE